MTTDERAVLDEFLRDLGRVIVNKSSAGEAKKKPLLLLLVLAMIKRRTLRENKIQFGDIEERLSGLITEYSGRPIESGPKPEQPFYHLRTSPFWELTMPGGLPEGNKRTLRKSVLNAPGAYAGLKPPSLFTLLQTSTEAREEAVNVILKRWWSHDEAGTIRSALAL